MSELSSAIGSYVYYRHITGISARRKCALIALARNDVHAALRETLRRVDELSDKETRELLRPAFIRRTFHAMRQPAYDARTMCNGNAVTPYTLI